MDKNIREEEDLFSKVFLNPLIVENILGHIPLKNTYPFRLVSLTWKNAIDQRISQSFILGISFHRGKCLEDLNHFISMKLTNVQLRVPQNHRNLSVPNVIQTFQTLAIHGNQIKMLILNSTSLKTEEDYFMLGNFAKSMPNLEILELFYPDIDYRKFLKFHHVFENCRKTIIRLRDGFLGPGEEAFVKNAVKTFPKLSENFRNSYLDEHLYKLIRDKKRCIPLRKITLWPEADLAESNLEILAGISLANVPLLTRLEIWGLKYLNNCLSPLTKVLENLAPILQYLKLYINSEGDDEHKYLRDWAINVVIDVPPMQKIRAMTLGMPQTYYKGVPCFLWDLGNKLAKDFPLLQELEFVFKYKVSDEDLERMYRHRRFWIVWEPFIPILRENADLSPLKFIKQANFTIPKRWLLRPENEEMKQKFLNVYPKLYGRVEKNFDYDFVKFNGAESAE